MDVLVTENTFCPYCDRYWTGTFIDRVPAQAACKDCIQIEPLLIVGHPDVNLNPPGGKLVISST